MKARALLGFLFVSALIGSVTARAETIGLRCYFGAQVGVDVWVDYGAKVVTVGGGGTQHQNPGTYPATITKTTISYSDGETANVIDRTSGIMTQKCIGGCGGADSLAEVSTRRSTFCWTRARSPLRLPPTEYW